MCLARYFFTRPRPPLLALAPQDTFQRAKQWVKELQRQGKVEAITNVLLN